MPSNRDQMYTFQLDSEAAERVNDGHYKVVLNPQLELPLLAEPQAMVRSVVFSNTAANVQKKLYNNASVELEWHPDVTASGANPPGSDTTATCTLEIPNGYYDLPMLQLELARQMYRTAQSSYVPETTPAVIDSVTKQNMRCLWHYYNAHVSSPPATTDTFRACRFTETSVWSYDSAAGVYSTALGMQGSMSPFATEIQAHLGVTAAAGATGFTGTAANISKKNSTDLLLWFENTTQRKFDIPRVDDITGISGTGIAASASVAGVKQYFNEYVDDKTNKPTGRGDLYVMLTLTKALTADVGTNADISILFDVTRRGLGVGHLAIPELNEHSDIGIALKMEECMAIYQSTFTSAASALHTVPAVEIGNSVITQAQRSVFPLYLRQDPQTGAVQFLSVLPDVKVKSTSTLFSQLLGYDSTLSSYESDQDLMATRAGYTKGKPFTATSAGRVTIARAVQVHIPTIVASTYDRSGRLQGNLMAQVPIPRGTLQNDVVSYQATTAHYVPVQAYGSSLDSVEFYLTNESGAPLDLQVSQFSITLTIGWAAPSEPMLGSAEAENLVRDIKMAYRR
jgi:hypothetical protein